MSDLILKKDGSAACPTCGRSAEGWEQSRGERVKRDYEEGWPGGPMLEVPSKQVVMEPSGPWTTTVHPCGHPVDNVLRET